MWMLSVSWCYDLYNWWRMGFYPPTWKSNIGASSFLYVSAGFFWNLSIFKVSKLMGHKKIETTMIYAHLAPGVLRDAIAVLEPTAP